MGKSLKAEGQEVNAWVGQADSQREPPIWQRAEERTGSVSTRPDSTVLDPFSQVKSEANNNGVNGK